MNPYLKTLTLSLVLLLQSFLVKSQDASVERCEPPFWWVGMQHPELQVMLHGNEIGHLQPEVAYPGVTLTRTVRVDNPNWLFLYFQIAGSTLPGNFEILLKDSARIVVKQSFSLKQREPGSEFRQGFNSEDVICLITPDRFANGDPLNDEAEGMLEKINRQHPGGRHGGDIEGIVRNIDYLAGLGYTALWINPLTENNQPSYSYHGYSTTDYYRIDPRFGSHDEYLRLSSELKKRGMKLIMDQIMNHCGSEHWWMKDLPDQTWVHYPDTYRQTNHMRTTLHDPYAADFDRRIFTDGWFVPTMPDLNQEHPLLGDYLIQNSIWWVEYAGLQGIRHDTHPYAGEVFMNRYTCRIMEEYPNFNIVGEEWSLNPAIVAKWQRGNGDRFKTASCLLSLMDFPLQHALTLALTENESWNSGWLRVYESLANDFIYADPENLVIFADNHDMDRFYRQVNHDFDLFRMGMVFLMTTRGIPQVYYGTEILMTHDRPGDHGQIRTDFPGGWNGDRINGFTGANLSVEAIKAQSFMRELMNWRKQESVIHHGNLKHFAPERGVYVYFRFDSNKTIMVILNKNHHEVKLDTNRYEEITRGSYSGNDVLNRRLFDFSLEPVLGRSAVILELIPANQPQ